MEVTFCLYSVKTQAKAFWKGIGLMYVPEILRFLFAGGAEPIHCPWRTTCCLEAVCIATRMDYGKLRVMILDHVHHNSIESPKDRYLNHRTLEMSSGLGAAAR